MTNSHNENKQRPYTLTVGRWADLCEQLYAVRRPVFIDELGVAPELEQDARDAGAQHLLIRDRDGRPLAGGRLSAAGQIGRVAVLPEWRGRGLGRVVMTELIRLAQRQRHDRLRVDARRETSGFFRRLGFRSCGAEFLEAGVARRPMRLALADWHPDRPPAQEISGTAEALAAALRLVADAGRGVDLYTPYVHPELFGSGAFAVALSDSVSEQPRRRFRLLLPPAAKWRYRCPPLAARLGRLSALQLRYWPSAEPRERSEFGYAMLLGDSALMLLTELRGCGGEFLPQGGRRRHKLGGFFNDCWERASADRELRPLGG